MSSSKGAMSSMLNFPHHRQRASGGDLQRVIQPSTNGSSYKFGQSIDLVIPGNQSGYMDIHSSYVRLKIAYDRKGTEATHALTLSPDGVFSFFSKIELLSSGTTISSIDEYSKLASIALSGDCNVTTRTGPAAVQYGMGKAKGYDLGQSAAAGTGAVGIEEVTLSFPLLMTALWSSSKYLPLCGNDLRIRLTLRSAETALILGSKSVSSGNLVTDAASNNWAGDVNDVTISPVELVMYKVVLTPEADAIVKSQAGDVYNLILNDYSCNVANVSESATSANFQLGASYSSLSRVFFGFYPNYSTAVLRQKGSTESHRITRNLVKYNFNVAGQKIPAQELTADLQGSTCLQENMNVMKLTGDFQHLSSITPANWSISELITNGGRSEGSTTAMGSRYFDIDLETQRNYDSVNGIYAGINTLSQPTSLQCTFSAGGTASDVVIFAEHQIGFKLDMSPMGTRTWRVQV